MVNHLTFTSFITIYQIFNKFDFVCKTKIARVIDGRSMKKGTFDSTCT